MNFKNIAEAFNYYKDKEISEIEMRTKEINNLIDTDANADIDALNIELDGLKQAKLNTLERKSKPMSNFNPITKMSFENLSISNNEDLLSTKEYRTAFFKTLLGQPLNNFESEVYKKAVSEKRSESFSTVTNSAAVLPTQTYNEVISKARTMGGLLSVCRGFNLPSKISVPIGTPKSKASWHTEGSQIESENPDIAAISFTGYEILKVFSISATAKKMSIEAFESYITDELTNCVMACIADAIVNGTGSAQGTGLLSGITWNKTGANKNHIEFSKTDGLTYKDITNTVALLKRGYGAGAKWAMNNATLYNLFYGLVDNNNRPIFIIDPKSESIGKILGFDVIVDDNLSDEVILFGNFNYMGYNLVENIAVEVSRESSFKSGLIDYRAMAIADCKPIITEAFIKLTRAAA